MSRNARQPRDQKLTVQLDRSLMDELKSKQEALTREFGVQVSLSQAAAAALRRGLEKPARS